MQPQGRMRMAGARGGGAPQAMNAMAYGARKKCAMMAPPNRAMNCAKPISAMSSMSMPMSASTACLSSF